jgi:FkbM family methyltransferase
MFSQLLAKFAAAVPSSLKYPLSGMKPLYTFVMGLGEPVITVQTAAGPVRWQVNELASQTFVLGTYEPHMQAAFKRFVQRGWTVYDVGGHAGYHTVLCALLVGAEGRVVSFEPNPSNFAAIKSQLELNSLNNVTQSPFALSDECGDRQMDTSINSSQGRISASGDIEVKAHTIDCLVADGSLPPPNLIKIDVEGHEEQVLRGGLRTIRRHQPVILCDYNDSTTLPSLESLLLPLGYVVEPGPPIIGLSKDFAPGVKASSTEK